MKSGFVDDLIRKIQNKQLNSYYKRDMLRCIANMASNCVRNESLKRMFDEVDMVSIMHQYIIDYVVGNINDDDENKYDLKQNVNH